MSSLKDWYRYVDSRARSRSGSDEPAERERAASESPETGSSEAAARPEAEAENPAPGMTGSGEEGLDVWSGLFSPPRKAEPKPTTAPLKRPAARVDEVPPDLPFARTPIDSPPAPRFPLPDVDVPIPSFDAFVPTAPSAPSAPAREAPAAEAPSVAAPPAEEPSLRGAAPGSASPPAVPADLPAGGTRVSEPAAAPGHPTGPVGEPTAAPERPAASSPPTVEEAPGTVPAGSSLTAALPGAPDSAPAPTVPPASRGAAEPESPEAGDEPGDTEPGQVPWRSPFQLPGPGRTVPAGASSPRPEPVVPRPLVSRHPPGTEAWERERVERLARTFRETLRTLEESLAARPSPGSPVTRDTRAAAAVPGAPPDNLAPEGAAAGSVLDLSPPEVAAAPSFRESLRQHWEEESSRLQATAAPAPPPVPVATPPPVEPPAAPADASHAAIGAAAPDSHPADSVPEARGASLSTPVLEAPSPESISTPREIGPALDRVFLPAAAFPAAEAPPVAAAPEALAAPVEEPIPISVLAPEGDADFAVADPLVSPSRRPAVSSEVRRNIEEAALMRQRLPQHIEMLLRIPTNEVAQNSYKSPFREGREELIRRLLDPQLTLEEAARILGVCPTTVRRYTNRGMLHCHRTPGNQRRFRMSDVLQFVEQYGDRIDRAAEARQFEDAA